MQRNKAIGRIVNVLLVIWVICMPFFWRFDLANGTSDYYDSFEMAPYAPVHIAVFYVLIFLSICLNGFSFWHILLLGFYFAFVQLVNYPYFTIRDVFLHGGPSEKVAANGQLTVPAGVPTLAEPSLDAAWPGTYFLQGMFMDVTGLGVIMSNYVLYFCLMTVVLLIVYSFSVFLSKNNYSLGWASALLFLPLFFNYIFDNFHLYSRTAFAFTLYFMFILVFLRFDNRTGLILSAILAAANIISHPFQSLALLAFVFAYAILIGRNRSKTTSLVFFLTTMFLAWIIFQTGTLPDILGRLGTFLSSEFTTPLAQSLTVTQSVPWWGVLFRNYFKYALGALLVIGSLASSVVLLKFKERTRINVGLTALLLSAGIILVSLLLLPDWQVARFTAFAAFPAAFSSLVLVAEIRRINVVKRFIGLFKRRVIIFSLLLFIITFSAASTTLRFESNHYYGELYHPSEMSSLSFFFANNRNSTLFIVSWRTYIYSDYFNYNYSHPVSMVWVTDLVKFAGNSTALLSDYDLQINESQFVLRGMRDEFTIIGSGTYPSETILDTIDKQYLAPRFDQVYSNGNYSLYSRTGK